MYDSAGKEIFAEHVQKFVSIQLISNICFLSIIYFIFFLISNDIETFNTWKKKYWVFFLRQKKTFLTPRTRTTISAWKWTAIPNEMLKQKKWKSICLQYFFFNENIFFKWDQPSVVMVVYDVTSETSFSSCAKWLERVRSQKPEVHIPGNYERIYCSIVLYVYVLIL